MKAELTEVDDLHLLQVLLMYYDIILSLPPRLRVMDDNAH